MINFQENKIFSGFSGNVLKIIALIAMTFDHIGKMFFPSALWMQIAGRLAFPVFAYMLAQGCRYTKNRKKYLLRLALFALIMQVVYYIFEQSLYMCIFVTFTLSVLLIYIVDNFLKKKTFISLCFVAAALCTVFFLTKVLPVYSDFWVDYGFFGIMLPAAVYYANGRIFKAVVFSLMLLLVSLDLGGIQIYSLFSVPLIALYNGKRGKLNLKYLFYVYYPLHLAVLYLIGEII